MLEKEIGRLIKEGFEVSFSEDICNDSLLIRMCKTGTVPRYYVHKEVKRLTLDRLPYEFVVEQSLRELERALLKEEDNE